MKFYTQSHTHYCGIDLHARSMYLCILNQDDKILANRNTSTSPEHFLKVVAPFREDLVAAVECIFTWYWLADLCQREGIRFVFGHDLYMKAIHGGKAKNDKVDSHKIAVLLRGGTLAQAYVYPPELHATWDRLLRRSHLVNKCAELKTHIQKTNSQYNLEPFCKKIDRKSNRTGIVKRFDDPSVQRSMALNLAIIDAYGQPGTSIARTVYRTHCQNP